MPAQEREEGVARLGEAMFVTKLYRWLHLLMDAMHTTPAGSAVIRRVSQIQNSQTLDKNIDMRKKNYSR